MNRLQRSRLLHPTRIPYVLVLIHGESERPAEIVDGGAAVVRGNAIHRESRIRRISGRKLIHHESGQGEKHHPDRYRIRNDPDVTWVQPGNPIHRESPQPESWALTKVGAHWLSGTDAHQAPVALHPSDGGRQARHPGTPIHRESPDRISCSTDGTASTPMPTPVHLSTLIHHGSTHPEEGPTT